jgi:hypothetical protein
VYHSYLVPDVEPFQKDFRFCRLLRYSTSIVSPVLSFWEEISDKDDILNSVYVLEEGAPKLKCRDSTSTGVELL